MEDEAAELGDGDALGGVELEDAAEDIVELVGKRQDGLEEFWVPEEGVEGGVVGGSLLPGVAATGEVH